MKNQLELRRSLLKRTKVSQQPDMQVPRSRACNQCEDDWRHVCQPSDGVNATLLWDTPKFRIWAAKDRVCILCCSLQNLVNPAIDGRCQDQRRATGFHPFGCLQVATRMCPRICPSLNSHLSEIKFMFAASGNTNVWHVWKAFFDVFLCLAKDCAHCLC